MSHIVVARLLVQVYVSGILDCTSSHQTVSMWACRSQAQRRPLLISWRWLTTTSSACRSSQYDGALSDRAVELIQVNHVELLWLNTITHLECLYR